MQALLEHRLRIFLLSLLQYSIGRSKSQPAQTQEVETLILLIQTVKAVDTEKNRKTGAMLSSTYGNRI